MKTSEENMSGMFDTCGDKCGLFISKRSVKEECLKNKREVLKQPDEIISSRFKCCYII